MDLKICFNFHKTLIYKVLIDLHYYHCFHLFLSLFQDLHNQGKTIAFVTHEPDIATFTTRKIKLRDGNIIEDEPINTQSAAEALAAIDRQKEE